MSPLANFRGGTDTQTARWHHKPTKIMGGDRKRLGRHRRIHRQTDRQQRDLLSFLCFVLFCFVFLFFQNKESRLKTKVVIKLRRIRVFVIVRRSQWPHGLKHEPSSLARRLGSWVRISLEAQMSVYVYSVIVLSCVPVAALRRAHPPSKESYRLCKDQETEKAAKAQQRAVEP
jgi:hypothetical protein